MKPKGWRMGNVENPIQIVRLQLDSEIKPLRSTAVADNAPL